jgi:hypothetical protein
LKKKYLKDGEKYIIKYIKSNKNKVLTCYVVNIEKEQLNIKLFNDMILNEFLKGETVQAGFFSKEDAMQLIEHQQLDLLKFL